MNELLLILHFLNKDTYINYRNFLNLELVQGDALILLNVLDDWYTKNETAPSLDDLYFLTLVKLDKAKCDLIFNHIKTLTPTESVTTYLNDLKQKSLLEKISLLSYEASNGKNVMDKLRSLIDKLDTNESTQTEFVDDNLDSIITSTIKQPGLRWRLQTLNRMLGSIRGGDLGIIVARPESGKTMMIASEVTYMAEQLKEQDGIILWINNEEAGNKVKLRLYQASLGVTQSQLIGNPESADREYLSRTKDKIKIRDNAVIHKKEVELLCKKHKPSLVVFDQLDKVQGFSSDREDLRLGAIYQWARELAKTYNCPVIGVSQADGSAENVQWLNMGHISNSKTSKAAEADWILGIGMLNDPSYSRIRYLSVMKNKLTGDPDTEPALRHGKMEVLFDPSIMRYADV